MNRTMKTFKIFSMAAVALCLAACSNSDDYSVQMPTQSADVLHFEAAVAAPNADATMRTVYTVDDTNIKVAWKDGDKIAVCISGGKDSMLLAKCIQELHKYSDVKFDVVYLVMNPGYNEKNTQKIVSNAELLNVPITIFESNIFECVEHIEDHPCYICARMRRGFLYKKAKELGCNKIALGHHFDDVIETVLMGMFYGAQFQTMMPKVKSTSHPGMELIRPLYYVKEADIINWMERNELEFIKCACKVTEKTELNGQDGTKRDEMKMLIKQLRQAYKNIDMNIMRSTENVNLDTIISYRKNDEIHHFLEKY